MGSLRVGPEEEKKLREREKRLRKLKAVVV